MRWSIMIQFMRRRNQIELFVRFKTDRSLKCLQYEPYVYHVGCLPMNIMCLYLIYLFGFIFDNGGSQKTENIGNT